MSINVFAGQPDLDAPNDPLAGVDDFVEWFGLGSPDAATVARINTALEIASAEIRSRHRIFTLTVDETITIDGSGAQTVLTPRNRLPITAVSQVEELQGFDYTVLDAGFYDWSADGILEKTGGLWCRRWTDRPRGIRVKYSHGYDPIPREVAGVCLAIARRLYDNPSGWTVKAKQIGDYRVEYASETGGILDDELQKLAAYESPV